MQVVYINGRLFRNPQRAVVPFEDRGYQFADAVYEVVSFLDGKAIDLAGHLTRLEVSVRRLKLTLPLSRFALGYWIERVRRENRMSTGIIYIQLSRGAAPRDFKIDNRNQATLVIAAKPVSSFSTSALRICFMRDLRWARVDIKTTGLLAASLAKTQAVGCGFDDAWLVDADGYVTEATSANAWIITRDNVLQTRQRTTDILCGVTRQLIAQKAAEMGLTVRFMRFTPAQALEAKAAFVTSATMIARPVSVIESTILQGSELIAELRQHVQDALKHDHKIASLIAHETAWVEQKDQGVAGDGSLCLRYIQSG